MIEDLIDQAHYLYQSGDVQQAVTVLSEALHRCDTQDYLAVKQNLLHCYWQLGQFDLIIDTLAHIKQLQGQLSVDQQRWLSNCLRYQARYDEAEAVSDSVADEQWRNLDLGWYEHLRGDTRRAFELTERGRPELGWSSVSVPANTRRWRGEKVSQLILLEEAGDGDMILFARWIPWLRQRCQQIFYAGHSTLAGVFQRLWGVEHHQTWSRYDGNHAVMAMMSLAHQLQTEQTHTDPYLDADVDWQYFYATLVPKTRTRIGICWSGAVNHRENHLRSVDPGLMISHLGDLAEILNLQMAAPPLSGVTSVGFREWEQTLALISTCDAVVSVDTAVAHAAAAMGIPTVVLTHRACYYTWKPQPPLSRSVWYPQAWNVTQTTPGDWTGAMQCARQQVIEILS